MNAMLRHAAIAAALLISSVSMAGEATPINATFGVQWMPVDWEDPADRITETLGAAGLPNGRTIGVAIRDHLDTITGRVHSDYVVLVFPDGDSLYAEYSDLPAGYDPATNTASFGGPLEVVGGEGRFLGATGTLTIRSKILFSMPVGTFEIRGVIKTAD